MSHNSDSASHTPHYDFFVSYAHEDEKPAQSLVSQLGEKGLKVWFDHPEPTSASDWPRELHSAVNDARVGIVLLSHASIASDFVRREWAEMQECSWRRPDFSICPVFLDNVEPPAFARKWNAVNVGNVPFDPEVVAIEIASVLNDQSRVKKTSTAEADRAEVAERFEEISRWANQTDGATDEELEAEV